MYCVKCGVKLQDGVDSCPLCGTPVWNPDNIVRESTFPDEYPEVHKRSRLAAAAALTVIAVVAELVILTLCLNLYEALMWGGYAMLGIALLYIIAVLPIWFHRPKGEIFVPIDHAAAAGYTLYICLKTGGHWFLSFAFPLALMSLILSTAMICLLKYVKGGRLFVFGGFLLMIGGFTVLAELFEHLTFGGPMFRWSLYSLIGFGVVGLFLLLAGMIPPLRHALERRFFF